MGFWDTVRDVPLAFFQPRVTYLPAGIYGDPETAASAINGLTVDKLWSTQPNLRMVVSFLARNVAQLPLHLHTMGEDGSRVRDRTSTAAKLLDHPDANTTTYEMIFALVSDLSLYDRAYLMLMPSADTPSGWALKRMPPTWVTPIRRNAFEVDHYAVLRPSGDGKVLNVPTTAMVAFSGYSPTSPTGCSPTIDSLRDTLAEQVEATSYRLQVWRRGGRASTVITRPADAPAWSPEARERFRESWRAKYTGQGPQAGGTPLLEDGMSIQNLAFNARDNQYAEAHRLSLQTVASAFHVDPSMVGASDGATAANVRELHSMLYGDTLGPILTQIQSRLNHFLLPLLGTPEGAYVEFNLRAKLQGSFEDEALALQTAVGSPWMTRNEARRKVNLPNVEGGDELITPLNVLTGAQASPTDSGSQNIGPGDEPRSAPLSLSVKAKADAPDEDTPDEVEALHAALAEFLARQVAVIKSKRGAGAQWWSQERWDRELTAVIADSGGTVVSALGRGALRSMDVDESYWSDEVVAGWVSTVAENAAKSINDSTHTRIAAAEEDEISTTYDQIAGRGGELGLALAQSFAGFAKHEAGKRAQEATGEKVTKRWITGSNPRPSHAKLNGDVVDIDEPFANGMRWPGDKGAGDDEASGCNCRMVIERSA